MKIFGFSLTKDKGNGAALNDDKPQQTFAPPIDHDGTTVISSASGAGYYGQYVDIDGTSIKNESDLIMKYRQAAAQPDCDSAIQDIVNASIVSDDDSAPVNLIVDDLDEFSEPIKKKIIDEFENIVTLLNFSENGHEYFRRWYVDGRIYFHVVVDEKRRKQGISEIREIEATKIKKVREVTTKIDKATGIKTVLTTDEYFIYNEASIIDSGIGNLGNAIKISPDAIIYVPSGLLDEKRK